MKQYEKGLKILEPMDELFGKAVLNHNIGLAYNGLKNYSEARKWFTKALGFSEQLNEPSDKILHLVDIAKTYVFQDNYPEVVKYLEQVMSIHNKLGTSNTPKAKKIKKLLTIIKATH